MLALTNAKLVIEPPDWPVFLTVVAGLLLAWEIVTMVRRLRRDTTWLGAILISLGALAAGPIVAGASLFYSVAGAAMNDRLKGRRMILAGLEGSVLAALGWLIWAYPCGGSILAIGFSAIVWAIRAYSRTTSPLQRRIKLILLAIRLTILLLLTVWAIGLTFQYTYLQDVRGVLLIGVDNSASMLQRDMPGDNAKADPVRRIEAVRGRLETADDEFSRLARQVDIEAFAFSESATPNQPYQYESDLWKKLLAAQPGPATAIGDSIQAAFDPVAAEEREIMGILLLSDGCNNTDTVIDPDKFAARMRARNVPIHTIAVGSDQVTSSVRALSVKALRTANSVSAFQRMDIKPAIEAIGLAGQSIKVTCKFGETVVGEQQREIKSAKAEESFEFTHIPLSTGFHRLNVTSEIVGVKPADLAGQPSDDMLVQVTDREIRILYVEGKFRYETKYIAQAMSSLKRISLQRHVVLQPLRTGEAPTFGENIEDWLRYHAIIFGDVAPENFTPKQLELVRKVVDEYGKGFAMIGGGKSFGSGGWQNTPIADILPVHLNESTGQLKQPVKPHPTKEGETNPIMQIGPADQTITQAWAELDSMPGANLLAGVKETGTTLAVDEKNHPMIVIGQFGKGRSLAVAFDTTWRWVLSPKDTRDRQIKFWRQVALYLANPKGNVWIHTEKTTYDLAKLKRGLEDVKVSAGVEDSSGQPLERADLDVRLLMPDTKADGPGIAVQLQAENFMRKGTLPISQVNRPGVYTLKITAKVDGKDLTAEQKFEVVQRNLESVEVLANYALLQRIAKTANGRFVTLPQLSNLLDELKQTTEPRKQEVTSTHNLGDLFRWPLVLLLIALLIAEWILRKKKGLV